MNPIKKLNKDIQNEYWYIPAMVKRKLIYDYINKGLSLGLSINKMCYIISNSIITIRPESLRIKYYRYKNKVMKGVN